MPLLTLSYDCSDRPLACVFLPTNEDVALTAIVPYIPTSSSTAATVTTATAHREYEKTVFLTPLDQRNRERGYSQYLPGNYVQARRYWETAYGLQLPAHPAVAGDDAVFWCRIETALGERTVPLNALARFTFSCYLPTV